ncbi:hypothetical protein QJQ45_029673, partial [Haematococcus lacustris]
AIGPHTEADKPGQPAQLAQLLAALPGMPQEPLLQCCICYLITRYGDWLARGLTAGGSWGAGGRASLAPCGGVLLALLQLAVARPGAAGGLQRGEGAGGPGGSWASCALLDMCCQCAPFLGEAVQPLLQLYQQLLGAGAVGQAAAAGGGPSGQGASPGGAKPSGIAGVAEEDVHTIMQAVCVATSRCLPPEQHPQAFHTLLQPALAQLQAAATALPLPSSPPAPGPRSPPLATQHPCLCPLLDRLAVLLSHTPTRPLAAQMMAQIWPGLDLVFERAAGDVRILERGCRLLRVGVKAAAREGGQLLPTLLPALVRHFQASSHSAFVYSLSEVLKVWGAEAASIGPVAEALTLLLQHATQQLTTYQQISSNPELMDDTFLLALRALTYSPRLLLGSQATSPGSQLPSSCLPALMECVTQGVLVQHREACMSVLSFLMRLLSRSLLDEVLDAASVLQALLAPRAAGLTRLLLAGVVGVLPTVRLPDLASVLGALLLMAGREGVAWVTAALESLPNNTVGAADKQAFASKSDFEAAMQRTPAGYVRERALAGPASCSHAQVRRPSWDHTRRALAAPGPCHRLLNAGGRELWRTLQICADVMPKSGLRRSKHCYLHSWQQLSLFKRHPGRLGGCLNPTGSHVDTPREEESPEWLENSRDPVPTRVNGTNSELYNVFTVCTASYATGVTTINGWVWQEASRYLHGAKEAFITLTEDICGSGTAALPTMQFALFGQDSSKNVTWKLPPCPYRQQGMMFTLQLDTAMAWVDFSLGFAGSPRRMLIDMRCVQQGAASSTAAGTPSPALATSSAALNLVGSSAYAGSRWVVIPVYLHGPMMQHPQLHARMLAHHTQYYMRLGFTHYLVFVNGMAQATNIWAQPHLQGLMKAGRLQLLRFNNVGLYAQLHSPSGQWGYPVSNYVRLMFTQYPTAQYIFCDLDEYVMLEQQPAAAGMEAAWQQISTCCGATKPSEHGDAPAEITFARAATTTGSGSELSLWVDPPPNSPSPLLAYSWRQVLNSTRGDAGKALILQPKAVTFHMVHWANLMEGQHAVKCPAECVGILHLVNQLSGRSKAIPHLDNSSAPWRAAFKDIIY